MRHGISRFVLSSTAALYGTPDVVPIPEDARLDSGHLTETASGFSNARCFGRSAYLACAMHRFAISTRPVQGIRPGRYGEDHRPETHLVPVGHRRSPRSPWATRRIRSDDYETPDGTCLRDYVHVSDLADAHLLALDRLGTGSIIANLGSRDWPFGAGGDHGGGTRIEP